MRLLFLDIETAPHKVYVWGLFNQNIGINQIVEPGYTLCWAAKWEGQKRVIFDSIRKSGEREMTEHIYRLIGQADAVVHYNGTKFDMPTLNNEFLKHELAPPDKYPQIDLLKTARRQFKLASNKLDYVAQLLGLGAKIHHRGMDLWRDCMAGNAKAWKEMREYNIRDVELLERVYNRLLPWIENHPNRALYDRPDAPVCRNCGSDNVVKVGTQINLHIASYERWRCKDCHKPLRGRTLAQKPPKELLV